MTPDTPINDFENCFPSRMADWNQIPEFITDSDALGRLRRLKAIVTLNRQLGSAISDLTTIQNEKFSAAEELAEVSEDDQNAKSTRQQLWAQMERANADQKLLTHQCISTVVAVLAPSI